MIKTSNFAVVIAFSIATFAFVSPPSNAKDIKFINTVVEKSAHELPFKQVGQAKFTVLFWDIYQSRLLTSSGSFSALSAQEPILFEIRYLRDITSKDLVDRTVEQWQHIGEKESLYSEFIQRLAELWPDIKKGDQLSLLTSHDGSSEFFHNGKSIGVIEAKEFGPLFLAIWLSEKTSQPKLRKRLLGLNS